jgi:metallo-beta-lactamase family protein
VRRARELSQAEIDISGCGILLPDSGHLQEEDARYANKRGFSKHKPALPLYTEDDARRCLPLLRPVAFGSRIDLDSGLTFELVPAGHILGSAMVAPVQR